MRSLRTRVVATYLAALMLGGCAGSAHHGGSTGGGTAGGAAPPPPLPEGLLPTKTNDLVVGGADTIGAIPGTPGAKYVYSFRQTYPASDRFTFQDRDLSFYFRPSPTVLHFQVENKADTPVWIDWDKSTFTDWFGSTKSVANADARWAQRFSALPPTQIPGLQRHSNYVFPIDYLVDPGASTDQIHRPLFPEDERAVQYADREFGVNLVFRVKDRSPAYTFRFKVRSVVRR